MCPWKVLQVTCLCDLVRCFVLKPFGLWMSHVHVVAMLFDFTFFAKTQALTHTQRHCLFAGRGQRCTCSSLKLINCLERSSMGIFLDTAHSINLSVEVFLAHSIETCCYIYIYIDRCIALGFRPDIQTSAASLEPMARQLRQLQLINAAELVQCALLPSLCCTLGWSSWS